MEDGPLVDVELQEGGCWPYSMVHTNAAAVASHFAHWLQPMYLAIGYTLFDSPNTEAVCCDGLSFNNLQGSNYFAL